MTKPKLKTKTRTRSKQVTDVVLGGLLFAGEALVFPFFASSLAGRFWLEVFGVPIVKDPYLSFYRIRRRGEISMEKKEDGWHIALTKKGKKRALSQFPKSISVPRKWDGRWRVVLFDIPTEKKNSRDALRRRLQTLGFKQLQKSAWVHPYPCEEELATLKKIFRLSSSNVTLLTVEKFSLGSRPRPQNRRS